MFSTILYTINTIKKTTLAIFLIVFYIGSTINVVKRWEK